MYRMRLNDRQIEAFRTVVALGSITAAAEAMFVTQPAISHLITDLEAELGFALFERVGRGVRPTHEAHLLYEEVERSYLGFSAIRERAELIRNGRVGLLRITAMPAFAETFVAPALGTFLRDFPEIGIELDVLNTTAIIDGVRRRRFDLGIAVPVFVDPALKWTVLRSAAMVAVMPRNHPLAAVEYVAAEHLAQHDIIALPMDSPYRMQLQAAVSRLALAPIRVTSTARTQAGACEIIQSGCGAVTIVDPCIANRYRNTLMSKPLEFELKSDLAICTSQADSPAPAVRFRHYLEEKIREFAEEQ